MQNRSLLFASPLLLLAGCAVPDLESPADVAELCADRSLSQVSFDVFIDDEGPGCNWGSDGNIDEDQGVYTARREDSYAVEGLENTVLCTLDFDFNGDFTYRDDFFLMWNQVVLVSNRGGIIDEFNTWMDYPLYEWDDIVEFEIPTGGWGTSSSAFCAGEDDGNADCEVPRRGQNGNWSGDLEYDADPAMVHDLAFRLQQMGGLTIDLAVTGDNDADEDCAHGELDLEVTGTGIVF